MKYPKYIKDQLKGKTKDAFIRALLKDGFIFDDSSGAIRVYRHKDGRRVTIHYHPHQTFERIPGVLKGLLKDLGWTVKDMKRLKLVK